MIKEKKYLAIYCGNNMHLFNFFNWAVNLGWLVFI